MTGYERIEAAGIPVVHTAAHRAAAVAMAEAVEKTVAVVARWSLRAPPRCAVHVLTDCQEFFAQTAPRRLRPIIRLIRPLWRRRAERAFALAGGWMMPWRGGPAVGVKPPETLPPPGSGLGGRLFVPVPDPVEKVRHLTCHELTHACTAHLRLPPWLNEGLAMRAVDHMAGEATVLAETRDQVRFDRSVLDSRSYRRLGAGDHDALVRLYATGYWVTRALDEERPEVLVELLRRRRRPREVARTAQAALRLSQAW